MPADSPLITVISQRSDFTPAAKSFAQRLSLPFLQVDSLPVTEDTNSKFLLVFADNGISLLPVDKHEGGEVRVDFLEGKTDHRRKYGGGAGQLIAKAVGIKPGIRPKVFDATAGLGQDAFVLATLGCEVLAMERSLIVFALLADGVSRALKSASGAQLAILQRLQIMSGDAVQWLRLQAGTVADVIYLDPMFPQRVKSSMVKKEMKYFKSVIGSDSDADALLAIALEKAKFRVVVKRPRLAPPIAGPQPALTVEGKSSRYDIYALKSMEVLRAEI
jgi:16S rRNA (guanine1516-N2)-methyltransferase